MTQKLTPGYYWFFGARIDRYPTTLYTKGHEYRHDFDEPVRVEADGEHLYVVQFDGGDEYITPIDEYSGVFITMKRPTEAIEKAKGRMNEQHVVGKTMIEQSQRSATDDQAAGLRDGEWKPWVWYHTFDVERDGETIPIWGPPCVQCRHWNPSIKFTEYRHAGVTMKTPHGDVILCHSDEQHGDFSCFRHKDRKSSE